MKNKFTLLGVLSVASLSLLLASCGSTTKNNYPSNAGDKIVDIDDNPYNTYEKYYDSLNSGDAIQVKALDHILIGMAKDKMAADSSWISDAWLKEEIEDRMISAVNSGTYDTDYVFDESKYVTSLTKNLYNVTCSAPNKDYVITPESTFSDIFKCDYTDYIEKYIKPEIYKRKLVADYIYNESYSSIGSTNARDVKIVAITDRTDKPGMARKLVNYFVTNYIDTEKPLDGEGDLDVLARLWKGVDIKTTDGTTKAQLENNGISTLLDKIDEEIAKIDLGDKDKTDLTLESQYTGSYTYSLAKGKKLAEDSLKKQDFITEGYFLKSNGLSSLPSELKSRIFSSNFNIDPASTKKDVTKTMPNGKRYLTAPMSEQGSSDDIVYYDSASKTYYLVEIRDVITNSALERKDGDSEEVAADKKKRAMEVAYEMAPTSNYTKNSTVHYLKNADIDWHDEDFYNYIKTNYADVFEEED